VPPSIAVVCGTFGDRSWVELAETRALPSAAAQTVAPVDVVHVHGPTLAAARNDAIGLTNAEWVIVVDADDQLDAGYVEAMGRAATPSGLHQPATVGVYEDGSEDRDPILISPKRSLIEGNWMVIGTMFERERMLRVGGYRELACLEDWDALLRLWLDGATFVQVPDAVYRVHVRSGSSRNGDARQHAKTFRAIRDRYRTRASEFVRRAEPT
jgi:glycosyltransferase involved in cell wall biosynthesis